MALPVLSVTTISSAWFAHTHTLSSSSIISPSAPLMLLVKTLASPATPPALAMRTTVSFPVLATKSADSSLLNCSPFAPKGGKPVVVRSGSRFHSVAAPPSGPVFQITPWNESEM